MRRVMLTAFAALLPLLVQATEQSEPQPGEMIDIPLEEWSAMAMGRTLRYAIDGELWALEHYYPGTNRVTLQFFDGTCLDGVWEHAPPLFCFHWDGEGTSCFRHARLGEEILILETRDGVETGAVQVMSGVSDTPLACGEPLTS